MTNLMRLHLIFILQVSVRSLTLDTIITKF
jgi:hypothetical protein